jgi:hypothetical protein
VSGHFSCTADAWELILVGCRQWKRGLMFFFFLHDDFISPLDNIYSSSNLFACL